MQLNYHIVEHLMISKYFNVWHIIPIIWQNLLLKILNHSFNQQGWIYHLWYKWLTTLLFVLLLMYVLKSSVLNKVMVLFSFYHVHDIIITCFQLMHDHSVLIDNTLSCHRQVESWKQLMLIAINMLINWLQSVNCYYLQIASIMAITINVDLSHPVECKSWEVKIEHGIF